MLIIGSESTVMAIQSHLAAGMSICGIQSLYSDVLFGGFPSHITFEKGKERTRFTYKPATPIFICSFVLSK